MNTSHPAARSDSPRRLTNKGEATRARIIDSAAELVFVDGVARTGISDVQQRAGVSASQIYHYFASKDDLIAAVIHRQVDAVLEAQQPVLDRLDSFQALEEWRDLLVAIQDARRCVGGCPLGSLVSEVAEDNETARTALEHGFARWEQPLRSGLARMKVRGDLTEDADTDHLALSLLVAVQGGLLLTQARRTTEPLRVGLDAALDHVRHFSTS